MAVKSILYLIMGKSGVGKTSVCEALSERYGLKILESYTTRPPRSPDEKGHIFVTVERYNKIKDEAKIAEVTFHGRRYCATAEQTKRANLYVIDPSGAQQIKSKIAEGWKGKKRAVAIYLYAPDDVLLERMKKRGCLPNIRKSRLKHDKEAFKKVDKIADIVLDASCDLETLIEKLKTTIDNYERVDTNMTKGFGYKNV